LWVALASGGNLIPLPLLPLKTENFDTSNISVYPNPASEELNVAIPFSFNDIYGKIIDVSGREVLNLSKITNKIDTSNLSNGMYILDILIDGKTFKNKFIVNKK